MAKIARLAAVAGILIAGILGFAPPADDFGGERAAIGAWIPGLGIGVAEAASCYCHRRHRVYHRHRVHQVAPTVIERQFYEVHHYYYHDDAPVPAYYVMPPVYYVPPPPPPVYYYGYCDWGGCW
jgi:hypothetical protein